MKKYILSFLLLVMISAQALMAKDYAYIYIEGDKQTPFYVKLEGQMMPRLGKNYCILPNMDAGVSNIEILFQQNQFPPQDFVIKVPEGGSRGFLLKKVNERQFALYDLQQGFYIVSGNSINDDRLVPVPTPAESSVVTNAPQIAAREAALPAFVPSASTTTKAPKPPKTQATESTTPAVTSTSTERTFINDIELNTDGGVPAAAVAVPAATVAATPKKIKKGKTIVKDTTQALAATGADEFDDANKKDDAALVPAGIPNSDCKTAMSNEAFEDFATKILDQTTDDDKLKVLIKSKDKNCFTTEQVRIIANNFETQSGRYEVARLLFSRTSDQDNFPKLEALFKTNYLKEKFKEIMNPK